MTTATAEPSVVPPASAVEPPRLEAPAAATAPDEIVVENPATGAEIGRVKVMDAAMVRQLVERARKAQVAWGRLTVEQRCVRLGPVQGLLLERQEDLAAAITRENGKTLQESVTMELTVYDFSMGRISGRVP